MGTAESYFVLSFTEDGDVLVKRFTKEQLEQRLNDEYWGENPNFLHAGSDFEHESGLLIIKGHEVTPGPVEIIKKWGV